jgi:ubiquinone/menaquinone biosynthesis C-methylase UbiE
MSIVFDRAAEYYDATRELPPRLRALPSQVLIRATNLSRAARVLELGIGTGRIAIPLASYLERLIGVDLSLAMMNVLRRKVHTPALAIQLAQADVVRLPFAAETFDVIYAVHVLHLVNGWRAAVAEAHRALKAGGIMLVSWHRREPNSANVLLRKELHRIAEEFGVNTKRPGAQKEEDIYEELRRWGGELRVVNVAEWTETTTPAQILDELDRQIYSETWMIPREVMDRAMPRLRAGARDKYGALDRAIDEPHNFRWLLVRKPLL